MAFLFSHQFFSPKLPALHWKHKANAVCRVCPQIQIPALFSLEFLLCHPIEIAPLFHWIFWHTEALLKRQNIVYYHFGRSRTYHHSYPFPLLSVARPTFQN